MALTKITSSLVAINSLTAANIADNAVDATKIASNSILTRHIDDDQVTGDQLADNLTIAGTFTSAGVITAASGKFATERGTAGAPTFTFSDDTDTGMYNVSNADLGFAVGGTDRLHIKASGNVGIATTSPATPLDIVAGSTGASPYVATAITMAPSNFTARTWQLRMDDGGAAGYGFSIAAAGNRILYLNNNNRVGINQVSPTKSLEVAGDTLISKAGDGNTPILHVKDTADTEVAWFEGNRAGDTGAFIAIRHNPSSAAESNRSGIKFQADDDGGNVTNYAQIKQYIEDNTGGTEDGRLGINIMSDGTDNEVVNIRKDQFIYKGDAGSSMFRIDNRADGHDVGFEIYQNGGRKWEIVNDDSHANQLDFRPGGSSEVFCIRDDGRLRVGLAPDIAGFLTVQKSNAGVPVFYAKNTNADSLAIRAEVNANSANNAIIEAVNSDGGQFKIRNDGTCFTNNGNVSSLSDQRLKTSIVDYTYDVAKFKSLRTRKFNWRNKEIHGNKDNIIGFIAQEVNIADSRWVDQGEISKDSQDKEYLEADLLAYSTPLTETDAMYVSVIQQLITRLETAEAKIAALE